MVYFLAEIGLLYLTTYKSAILVIRIAKLGKAIP